MSEPIQFEKVTSKSSKSSKYLRNVCNQLEEPKKHLIRRVLDTVHLIKVLQLLDQVHELEKLGGVKTKDGTRNRTKGGIFFHLLRNDPEISKEQIKYIFEHEEKYKIKKKVKKKRMRKYQKRKAMINNMSNEMDKLSLKDGENQENNNPSDKVVETLSQMKIQEDKDKGDESDLEEGEIRD